MKKLSTTTSCPKCKNKNVYLVQCNKLIYKACDKCKTIYYCNDAYGLFTDMGMEIYFKEHPNKTMKDYEKKTFAWMDKKFKKYKRCQEG